MKNIQNNINKIGPLKNNDDRSVQSFELASRKINDDEACQRV